MGKKINFTAEHLAQLKNLAVEFLFDGITFRGALSTPVSVYDIIHNSTVNSLRSLLATLNSLIKQKEESTDRWSADNSTQKALDDLKKKSEFIDLLIGYKRALTEEKDIAAQRAALQEQLEILKNSTMSPAEQIAALEKQLSDL